METVFILNLTVLVSCTSILYHCVKQKRWRSGWLTKALILGSGAILAFEIPILARTVIPVWFVFILLPGILLQVAEYCCSLEQFQRAILLAKVHYVLHPFPESREIQNRYKSLLLLEEGAFAALQENSHLGTQLPYLLIQAEQAMVMGDLDTSVKHLEELNFAQPVVFIGCFRARALQGHIHRLPALLKFAEEYDILERHDVLKYRAILILLAFTGDESGVRSLLASFLKNWNSEKKKLWLAISLKYNGKHAEAVEIFTALTTSRVKMVQFLASRELQTQQPAALATTDEIKQIAAQTLSDVSFLFGSPPHPKLLIFTIFAPVLLLASFFAIMYQPTLESILSLNTRLVLAGYDSYRLISLAITHVSVDHLLFNMCAMALFSFYIERKKGVLFTAAVFIITVLGASFSMVGHAYLYGDYYAIGASGGVLGMLGYCFEECRNQDKKHNSPLAQRFSGKLRNVIVLQIIFDLLSPRNAMAGHVGGFLTGMLFSIITRMPRVKLRKR